MARNGQWTYIGPTEVFHLFIVGQMLASIQMIPSEGLIQKMAAMC